MSRHNLVVVVIVLIAVGISFFIDVDNFLTGFSVGEDSVETEVEKLAREHGEVKVIVIIKEEGRDLFMNPQEIDIDDIKRNLGPLEFKEGYDLEEIHAFSGEVTKTGFYKLKNDPNVDIIQLDHEFSVELQDSVPLIRADTLHKKVLINNITGINVSVCVLDTGLNYTHPDLRDNYVGGYDFVNSDGDPYDDHGHGTHVSGIVAGVAPGIGLVHVKVLDLRGSGSESTIVAGINWCITNKDAYRVVALTMSLGGGLFTDYCDSAFPALTAAINNAADANITVIASSGNDGSMTHISAPACIQNAIGVGATDKSDALAGYSNRNNILDLLAPGSNIRSTSWNGDYEILTGTSMAAPHVAGAVALLQQFAYEEQMSFTMPLIIENILKNKGLLVGNWKRINVLDSAHELDIVNPQLVVDSPQNTSYLYSFIDINYSARDVFLDRVSYRLNNGSVGILNGNVTLSLDGGKYVLSIYANDSKGNLNSSTIDFSILLPSVILNSPNDNENDIDGLVYFNCSAHAVAGLDNISLYHNATGLWHPHQKMVVNSTEASLIFNVNFTERVVFSWSCLAVDKNNIAVFGNNRTLRIQYNTAPIIDSFYPSNLTVRINEPENRTFNISYHDPDGDKVIVYWFKDGSIVDNDSHYVFNGDYRSSGVFNITAIISDGYLNGIHYWNFVVNDVEYCGDGVRNSTEECDGSDFGGKTCDTYGFNSGNLICVSCTASTSSCSNSTRKGDGSSGGGGSGSDDEERRLLEEARAAQQVIPEGGSSESEFDESAIFEEQRIETAASASEDNQVVQQESRVAKEGKDVSVGYIFGIIGGILGILLVFYFIRREWRYMRGSK